MHLTFFLLDRNEYSNLRSFKSQPVDRVSDKPDITDRQTYGQKLYHRVASTLKYFFKRMIFYIDTAPFIKRHSINGIVQFKYLGPY